MANEIRVSVGLECINANLKIPKMGSTTQITQNVQGGPVPGMVTIGTSEEDIPTTDIATLGWCYMKNLDVTNYIKYGPKSAGSMVEFGRLYPGEECVFRLAAGITIRAIADTGACKCLIFVLNH